MRELVGVRNRISTDDCNHHCATQENSINILDVSAKKLCGKEVVGDTVTDNSRYKAVHGYKMIESSMLLTMLNSCSLCSTCNAKNNLMLEQDDKKRKGLCERTVIKCRSCNNIVNIVNTSYTLPNNMYDVNVRSVHASTSSGGALTSLRNFCTSMDLPAPIYPRHYGKTLNYITKLVIDNCENSRQAAAENLRKKV